MVWVVLAAVALFFVAVVWSCLHLGAKCDEQQRPPETEYGMAVYADEEE